MRRKPEHMAALPWRDVPQFIGELRAREGISARCLEFLILTASRSGEARGARWTEIDGDIWTVPAKRMKRGVPHRVPLTPEALAVLEKVRTLDADLVFPSPNMRGGAKVQSDMTFASLLRRMERAGFTVHGFRSSFRDWASESAHAAREVAEAALSHVSGNEVERAYARSDLFERRRKLMEQWARFVTGASGNVAYIAQGNGSAARLPDAIKNAIGPGGRPDRLRGERHDIEVALDYIASVEAGDIKDRSHIKTVADAFGVHRTTVQAWCRDPDLAAPGLSTPDQALARMRKAGTRYHFNRTGERKADPEGTA
jgi:Phage integrase family